jgi:hypothetical protein
MGKKRAIKKESNNSLEQLLKNAENDPEAYALLQALKQSREQPQQTKVSNNKVRQTPPKDSRVDKNPNIQNKSKSAPRTRRVIIGNNEFDPNKFKREGRDEADKILRSQNVITNNERPVFHTIEARCSICGHTENVPPTYVLSEYYRCEKCSRT